MKLKYKILLFLGIIFIAGCDLYPDWHNYVKYSDAYPICGEYIVKDYNMTMDTVVNESYHIYIYNKAYNPTGDSIWVDNRSGHPAGVGSYDYKYKIKCKADTINLTFDVTKAGDVGSNPNPLDSCNTVTIKNSKIWDMSTDITDPAPDSIYFEVTFYDPDGNIIKDFITAGHRKTGWEEPNYSDDM